MTTQDDGRQEPCGGTVLSLCDKASQVQLVMVNLTSKHSVIEGWEYSAAVYCYTVVLSYIKRTARLAIPKEYKDDQSKCFMQVCCVLVQCMQQV